MEELDDLKIAEQRVSSESPVHGPELLSEIKRLREREIELIKSWAADDHESRMLRFYLYEIEMAAKTEGRHAIAHMAETARTGTATRSSQIKSLIEAVGEFLNSDDPYFAGLSKAYKPFESSVTV